MIPFKTKRNSDGHIEAVETSLTGNTLLHAPKLNKASAFTREERKQFQLLGKLPPRVETIEEQAARIYNQYQEKNSDLQKNIYLTQLFDNNETLFYKVASEHLKEMLPIVYTPTIGEAVERFSHEFRRQRGLFISYENRDYIEEILDNRATCDIDIILVTDGEGVLGIGDQGIGGMDIAIGKLMVYTICAGINPTRVLPIQLDVGTNNQDLLDDPMYLGLKRPRITGQEYDDFIDRFVGAVRKKIPNAYLHWEDFGRDNARKNLERYREKMLTFNDDMQGTGATALSCILSATDALGEDLTQQRVVFFGAGTAGVGIADQVKAAMVRKGLTEEQACQQIYLIDRDGLLLDDMDCVVDFQRCYAKPRALVSHWLNPGENANLLDVVEQIKPSILIGCSTVHGAFNEQVVKAMCAHHQRPIIFPLSNPTSHSEAKPQDLLNWSSGNAVIATGSPFNSVSLNGKTFRISQSNNAFVFPGIGLGVVAVKAKSLPDSVIWAACQALSECSPMRKDSAAPVLPDLDDIKNVSLHIAKAVAKAAIDEGLAEPQDIDKAIAKARWEPKYYPYRFMNWDNG